MPKRTHLSPLPRACISPSAPSTARRYRTRGEDTSSTSPQLMLQSLPTTELVPNRGQPATVQPPGTTLGLELCSTIATPFSPEPAGGNRAVCTSSRKTTPSWQIAPRRRPPRAIAAVARLRRAHIPRCANRGGRRGTTRDRAPFPGSCRPLRTPRARSVVAIWRLASARLAPHRKTVSRIRAHRPVPPCSLTPRSFRRAQAMVSGWRPRKGIQALECRRRHHPSGRTSPSVTPRPVKSR